MKCHYEVLSVSRDASDDELKKAYRSLALRWHPDKNLDNNEEAKVQFQIIQQAYSVLSDPQDRAFYDKHRESIIRGADYEETKLDVYAYFRNDCFENYGDDAKSFYTVYRGVFNKLAEEESEFSSDDVPDFGYSTSKYEEVEYFYNYWLNFCTKKSYSWKVEYDVSTAPDRRISRLMEKENKKVRDRLRKDRNEEVRELVKFVRKRDRRVLARSLELKKKSEENMRKAEENRKRMIQKHKEQIAELSKQSLNESSAYEADLKRLESSMNSDSSDDSEDDYDLYCIVCEKYFKNEKTFETHQNSKKHKENVASVKDRLLMDEDLLRSVNENENVGNGIVADNVNNDEICSDSSENVEEEINNLNIDEENIEINENQLYCDICDQHFKNEKALSSHKNSTKHKKNVTKQKRAKSSLSLKNTQNLCNSATGHPVNNSAGSEEITVLSAENERVDVDIVTNNAVGSTTKKVSENDLKCRKCNKFFSSKNKLFKHLDDTGHAVIEFKTKTSQHKIKNKR